MLTKNQIEYKTLIAAAPSGTLELNDQGQTNNPGHAYYATYQTKLENEQTSYQIVTISADPKRTPNRLSFEINAKTRQQEQESKQFLESEFDDFYQSKHSLQTPINKDSLEYCVSFDEYCFAVRVANQNHTTIDLVYDAVEIKNFLASPSSTKFDYDLRKSDQTKFAQINTADVSKITNVSKYSYLTNQDAKTGMCGDVATKMFIFDTGDNTYNTTKLFGTTPNGISNQIQNIKNQEKVQDSSQIAKRYLKDWTPVIINRVDSVDQKFHTFFNLIKHVPVVGNKFVKPAFIIDNLIPSGVELQRGIEIFNYCAKTKLAQNLLSTLGQKVSQVIDKVESVLADNNSIAGKSWDLVCEASSLVFQPADKISFVKPELTEYWQQNFYNLVEGLSQDKKIANTNSQDYSFDK
jgi:hypothetical protein